MQKVNYKRVILESTFSRKSRQVFVFEKTKKTIILDDYGHHIETTERNWLENSKVLYRNVEILESYNRECNTLDELNDLLERRGIIDVISLSNIRAEALEYKLPKRYKVLSKLRADYYELYTKKKFKKLTYPKDVHELFFFDNGKITDIPMFCNLEELTNRGYIKSKQGKYFCKDCGKVITGTEKQLGYCSECYHKKGFYLCKYCNTWHKKEDIAIMDYYWYDCTCKNCYNKATICECGNLIFDNKEICYACVNKYNALINGYHHTKGITFFGNDSDRFFGVEIEQSLDTEYDRARLIKGLTESKAFELGLFELKSDSSISNYGVEIVTQPMTLRYFSDNILQGGTLDGFFDALSRYGNSNQSCGMHIHVSRSGLNSDFCTSLAFFGHHNGSLLFKVSEREDKSNFLEWANNRYDVDECEDEDNFDEFSSWVCLTESRYRSFNFCNVKTIECRIFASTEDADTVEKRIEWYNKVIDFCNDTSTDLLNGGKNLCA